MSGTRTLETPPVEQETKSAEPGPETKSVEPGSETKSAEPTEPKPTEPNPAEPNPALQPELRLICDALDAAVWRDEANAGIPESPLSSCQHSPSCSPKYRPPSPEREESGPLNRTLSAGAREQWECTRMVGCLVNAVNNGDMQLVVKNSCSIRAKEYKMDPGCKASLRESLFERMLHELEAAEKARKERAGGAERETKRQKLEERFTKGEEILHSLKGMHNSWCHVLKIAVDQSLSLKLKWVAQVLARLEAQEAPQAIRDDLRAVLACKDLLVGMQGEMVDVFGFVSKGEEFVQKSSDALIGSLFAVEKLLGEYDGPKYDASGLQAIHDLEVLFKCMMSYPPMHHKAKMYVSGTMPSAVERAAGGFEPTIDSPLVVGKTMAAFTATCAELLKNREDPEAICGLMDRAMECGDIFKHAVCASTNGFGFSDGESGVLAVAEAVLAFAQVQTEDSDSAAAADDAA
jgi:hypothetical protein